MSVRTVGFAAAAATWILMMPTTALAQYAQTFGPAFGPIALLLPAEQRKPVTAAPVVDDREILQRIKAALAKKSVAALGLQVKSTDGNVEITGAANNQVQVDQAVSIASNVAGVRSVRSEVRVN